MRQCAALLLLAAACGSEVAPDPCAVPVRYTSDVLPVIVVPKCLPCHSVTLDETRRRNAPVGLDFDTAERAQPHFDALANAITSGAEPPKQVVPELATTIEERDLATRWRACGLLP